MPHWRTPQHDDTPLWLCVFLYVTGIAAVCVFATVLFLGAVGAVRGQEVTQEWLLSWIPATCCVTNKCCWQVSEGELRSLPEDNWLIKSTGQVRKRTAWSPDGKFYRCACDYDPSSQHWVRHQGANTRCVFVPMRSAVK